MGSSGGNHGFRVGGRTSEEIVAGELDASPTIRLVIEALKARVDVLAQIRTLDAAVRSISRGSATVRHLMTVPGVGVVTALGFVFHLVATVLRGVAAGRVPWSNMYEFALTGLLLIIGIDQFLDMGRSATNVIGNSLATAVVGKWEGDRIATYDVPEAESVEVPV